MKFMIEETRINDNELLLTICIPFRKNVSLGFNMFVFPYDNWVQDYWKMATLKTPQMQQT